MYINSSLLYVQTIKKKSFIYFRHHHPHMILPCLVDLETVCVVHEPQKKKHKCATALCLALDLFTLYIHVHVYAMALAILANQKTQRQTEAKAVTINKPQEHCRHSITKEIKPRFCTHQCLNGACVYSCKCLLKSNNIRQ